MLFECLAGFGRIGRLVLRASLAIGGVQAVAVNDPYLEADHAVRTGFAS